MHYKYNIRKIPSDFGWVAASTNKQNNIGEANSSEWNWRIEIQSSNMRGLTLQLVLSVSTFVVLLKLQFFRFASVYGASGKHLSGSWHIIKEVEINFVKEGRPKKKRKNLGCLANDRDGQWKLRIKLLLLSSFYISSPFNIFTLWRLETDSIPFLMWYESSVLNLRN